MFDLLATVIEIIRNRWRHSSWMIRTVLVIAAVAIISLACFILFWAGDIQSFVREIPDSAKVWTIIVILIGWVLTTAYTLERGSRVEALKGDNLALKNELQQLREEVKQNDDRNSQLLNIESRVKIWQKLPVILHAPFVPSAQRKTRFVTVLNLKGGVGKTILTANLAACLASSPWNRKVLLVDTDFQGTLGSSTVDPAFREIQERNEHLVQRMLGHQPLSLADWQRLPVSMMNIPNAKVILAADSLDLVDFELQARFFLDANSDPRFRFLASLHQPTVLNEYDYVLFDCPPRVTVSVVNALLCSDYVLIPTRLDRGSIESVPRTISWIKSFGPICHVSGLGVIANHVAVRNNRLVKADQASYGILQGMLSGLTASTNLFQTYIRTTSDALNRNLGLVASTDDAGREVFTDFVKEFCGRMGP